MRSSIQTSRLAHRALRLPRRQTRPALSLYYQTRPFHNQQSHVQCSATSKHSHRAGVGRIAALTILVAFGFISYQAAAESTAPNPQAFLPYTITSKERLSETNSIFTLRASNPLSPLWATGLWSVEFKQPQLQVARSYTPLPPSASGDPTELRFLIKKETGGEVSTYLHRLSAGDEIEIRGPHVEYAIPEGVQFVLFIAGGTGIAPALQAAHTLLAARGEESACVEILWANRKAEDSLGKRIEVPKPWYRRLFRGQVAVVTPENSLDIELKALQETYGDRFILRHFVDEEGSYISERVVKSALARGIERKVVMVSGPEGFVTALAGRKVWTSGRETQGRLGGIIGKLGKGDWEVVKL